MTRLVDPREDMCDSDDGVLIHTVFGSPGRCKYLEDRKKVLKLSVRKLRQIEDPETSLCRSVLINNTMKRIQQEIREERKKSLEFDLPEPEINPSLIPEPPDLEDDLSSSSDSSSSSSDSCSSSSSSSDDEDEPKVDASHRVQPDPDDLDEDDILSASDMKRKARKRQLESAVDHEPCEKVTKTLLERNISEEAEDLLNEVYMPPSIGNALCLEDEEQLTVPLPLQQQEQSLQTSATTVPAPEGCTITPYWSTANHVEFFDESSWSNTSSRQNPVPWVTISPTNPPSTPHAPSVGYDNQWTQVPTTSASSYSTNTQRSVGWSRDYDWCDLAPKSEESALGSPESQSSDSSGYPEDLPPSDQHLSCGQSSQMYSEFPTVFNRMLSSLVTSLES